MPQVEISIGGRTFDVACQDGEEQYLHSAAAMLDTEAQALTNQVGRQPEARMLLLAGLMLADRTAGLEEKVRALETETGELRAAIETLKSQPAPAPQRVEVPVIPAEIKELLAEIAARAEALADKVENQ